MINIYRKAVYNACATTSIPVYDYWVTAMPYPYIIISSVDSVDVDLKMNTKTDFIFTIDIFDKQEGKATIVNYAADIKAILKEIDGIKVSINTRYFSDVEPNVTHAMMTLRFTKYN